MAHAPSGHSSCQCSPQDSTGNRELRVPRPFRAGAGLAVGRVMPRLETISTELLQNVLGGQSVTAGPGQIVIGGKIVSSSINGTTVGAAPRPTPPVGPSAPGADARRICVGAGGLAISGDVKNA